MISLIKNKSDDSFCDKLYDCQRLVKFKHYYTYYDYLWGRSSKFLHSFPISEHAGDF